MTRHKTPKHPQAQDLAARIGAFVALIDDKRDGLFAVLSLWLSMAVATDDIDAMKRRRHELQWALSTTRACVADAGKALAAELEAQGIDPLPLRELLAHVEREEYETVDQTWPHVKAWLQGAPARLRAGRPVGDRGEDGTKAGEDNTRDYRPATEVQALLGFSSYKVFVKWLDDHPEIRRHKPSENRLLVHVADALASIARKDKRDFETADRSAPEIADDYAKRTEERKAKENKRRARRVV